MTGITAAHYLHKHQYQVTVFEKSRGIGGRLSTKRLSWAWIDIGTQYFTAQDTQFRNLLNDWIAAHEIDVWKTVPYIYDDGKLQLSPDYSLRYVGTPKMNSFLHAMLNGFQLEKNTEINSLHREGDNWMLTDSQDQEYGPFDYIISTAPPKQSAQLFKNISPISDQLDTIEMNSCWSAALHYSERLADHLDPRPGSVLVHDRPIQWIACNTSKPARQQFDNGQTWIIHFNPQWSGKYIHKKPAWIIEKAYHELAHILGIDPVVPVESLTQRWKYAYIKDTDTLPGIMADNEHKILCAGDWSNGDKVEDAYLSGREAVTQLRSIYEANHIV